ncbi:MAG: hypothetical protein HUJ57_08940 [Erysipelotrichaceae bacterium]|nr:hypothetical protein [Erysipelotrichaceae bacterium]
MKLDLKGIRFNLWLSFFFFALGIIFLFGILQISLIKPYYRGEKIKMVREVASQFESQLTSDSVLSEKTINNTFQLNVDNNVCSVIFNERGQLIYSADSLGAGCVFNQRISVGEESVVPRNAGSFFVNEINNAEGEYSINLFNEKTQQDMIVYGKVIRSNLGNMYLMVNSPLAPVDSITEFYFNQYRLYMIVGLGLSLVVALFISNRLATPMVKMKKVADVLASGDYDVNFEGSYYTETNELANTLNDATHKLGQIDELRKDLIANVSHDIKTPLTMIRGYAEMIKDISGDNPAKREEHLDVILREVEYLDHLVQDMSQLAKMQSGNYELWMGNFDLSDKVRNIVELNEPLISQMKLHVELDLPESCTVYADETKIGQVVYNFVSNAIKHSFEGGNIYIRLVRAEDFVRFEIKDEGEGIPAEDLPLIWDRYFKIDKQFSRKIESTGLGLAIVKAILDNHHAKYGVESEEGKGSTFWFELEQENGL